MPEALKKRDRSPILWALVAAYLSAAILRASHAPLWMDEVLAVTAGSQHTWREVYRAIWAGTDFSPPTFHFLLHVLLGMPLHTELASRVASITAALAASACMYVIARRRFNAQLSNVVLGVTLASPLFDYAVQARQYALTTCLLAGALALWDSLPASTRNRRTKLLGIWAAMAACVSLHFYGIVCVGALVLCEILWSLLNRKRRPAVWFALVAVIPVFLAWMPLATHLRKISAADQIGPGFYGYPTLWRFVRTFIDLTFGGPPQIYLYGGIVFAIAMSGFLPVPRSSGTVPGATDMPFPARDRNLVIIMAALGMIPVSAYMLGIIATGSFVSRYAIGVTLLPGLAIACALSATSTATVAALLTSPFIVFSLISQAEDVGNAPLILAARQLVLDNPSAKSITVGDGLLYIEMVAALPAADRERVVYLAKPVDAASPDPTNENEVFRLASFDHRFNFVRFEQELKTNDEFYLLRTQREAMDVAFQEMLRRHFVVTLAAENSLAQLFLITPLKTGAGTP